MPGQTGDTQIADELAKNVPNFDIDAARHAGATDAAIISELAPQVPTFDVAGARAHFAQAAAPAAPTAPIAPPAANFPGQNFVDHAVDVATAGFGNKALAALQGIGSTDGSTYDSRLAALQQQLASEGAGGRAASIAGGVVGGVVSPLNKVLAPLGLIGSGALQGALQGAGHSDGDLGQRVLQTATGLVGGGLTAGAFGAVMKMFGPSAGSKVVAAALAKSPDAQATLDQLVNSGRGDVATLADLSPRLNGVLDRSANRNPDVIDAVQNVISSRQPDAAGRLTDDLASAVGSPHADAIGQQLAQQRLQWADGPQGFQGLRDNFTNLPVGRDLQSVLAKPGMMDALNQVKKADNLAGTNVGNQVQKSFGAGGLGLTAMAPNPDASISYTTAAQFERALDGLAGKAGNSDVPLMNAYKTLRNGVGDFLEATVPEHATVKATYAEMKNNEEALAAGAKAWTNPSARSVASEFGALSSDASKDFYRKGLASSALDQLANRNTNLNAAAPLVNASGSTQAKLQMLFPDQPAFSKFMDNVNAEATLAKLNSAAGGSATARRGADEAGNGVNMAARAAMNLAHGRGFVSTALHTALPGLMYGMRNQTAADAGSLLTAQGSDAITQLMQQLGQQGNTANLLSATGAGVAGGAGGAMSGLLSH